MTFNRRSILKRISLFVAIVSVLSISTTGYGSGDVALALITKIIQEVMRKSQAMSWIQASKGDVLVGGDQVRTGINSLAVIKFTDNSIMRLRERSLLVVNAEGARGSTIKTLSLQSGSFGFSVKKQHNEQFELTSPTSVASIRGTKGKWSTGQGRDTLVVNEGLVNLKNLVSNRDVDIAAGYIGFSNQDGSLFSRRATEQELAEALSAASSGDIPNELKLELKDPNGKTKELKLDYEK